MMSAEQKLIDEILAELQNARTKFPGSRVTGLAMVEEVGEVAKAIISESRDAVRKECVQTAVMAMRIVLDGDSSVDQYRAEEGLDRLTDKPILRNK